MRTIAISVFDERYFDYAARMFLSLRAFNPWIELFAGDFGLTTEQWRYLAAQGVTVLQAERGEALRARGLSPTFTDFLLHAYLRDTPWDRLMWIDADTVVLADLSEAFDDRFDVVGHPGRSSTGSLMTVRDAYAYYPPSAEAWLREHLPVRGEQPYFATGLWTTRSRRLLERLDTMIDLVPPDVLPADSLVFTAVVHDLGLAARQLDPAVWNFSRDLVERAAFDGASITYDGISPVTAGLSGLDDGRRAHSAALEQFFDGVVRKTVAKRPVTPLIDYVWDEHFSHVPKDKLANLDRLATRVIDDAVEGDIVECGSWRGGSALVLANAATGARRTLHLFDTFEGMPAPTAKDYKGDGAYPGSLTGEGGSFGEGSLSDTSPEVVRGLFNRFGMDMDAVRINQVFIGDPPRERLGSRIWRRLRERLGVPLRHTSPLAQRFPAEIALLSIDVDFYEPYRWILEHMYKRIPHGGIIVFDDYGHWIGARRAVDEFIAASGELLQCTATSQAFVVKTTRAFLDLDDFCEEYMSAGRWQVFDELRRIYPNLRATMFTIPGKSSDAWLRWVRTAHPWIEMAIHGSEHEDREEWLADGDEVVRRVRAASATGVFCNGFKAPWWRLSRSGYDALRAAGYWVATNKTNDFAQPSDPLNYRYDAGEELLADVQYRHTYFDAWHGHVQSQREFGAPVPNGVEDVFDRLATAWHPQARFGFISELFAR